MKSTKKYINKIVSSIMFGKKEGKKVFPKMKENSTDFKEELKKFLGVMETKSSNMDYQQIMKFLYTVDSIKPRLSPDSQDKSAKIQDELASKIEKEEKSTKSNFFNEFSLKILEETNNKELINIACKSFVGDVDIPHNPARSFLILELAKSQCEKAHDKREIQFYLDYFRKEKSTDPEEVKKACDNIFKDKENIKARYISARDLFNIITYNMYNVAQENPMSDDEREFIYQKVYNIMEEAIEAGIYEANYILGLMYLNGFYIRKSNVKAFYYFSIAASYSHGMAYYQLYKFLKEDNLNIYKENEDYLKKLALFDYLSRSAEEGYLEAMHELGNHYISGNLRKKNYLKALAWHRHACRNGYILSYEPCGDIFYNGGHGVKKNKALSLVMYYSAYTNGIKEVKEKVLRVTDELREEGEPIPEMVLV